MSDSGPDRAGEGAPGRGSNAPRRFALLLEYDGGGFAGSQMQANARTVQSVLEDAIRSVTGETARAAFAGRTDSGAHAIGQTASFMARTRLGDVTMARALNARLPGDVVVREVVEVEPGFDVRRQAIERQYRYRIKTGSIRPVLERERAWFVPAGLEAEAMSSAAKRLVGIRDFAAFAGPMENADASTVRELRAFEVSQKADVISCDLAGNAFLPHQVRRMVGALVEVGRGRLSEEGYSALLAGPPASAGPSAPAHGLYLMKVKYESELFSRASATTLGLDWTAYVC